MDTPQLMLPSACTLTMVAHAADTGPLTLYPAVTTRYNTDEAMLHMDHVEIVLIEPSKNGLTLKAVCHVDCNCAPIHLEKLDIPIKNSGALKFIVEVNKVKQFYWIISTPSYEVRMLIDSVENSIHSINIIERILQ